MYQLRWCCLSTGPVCVHPRCHPGVSDMWGHTDKCWRPPQTDTEDVTSGPTEYCSNAAVSKFFFTPKEVSEGKKIL